MFQFGFSTEEIKELSQLFYFFYHEQMARKVPDKDEIAYFTLLFWLRRLKKTIRVRESLRDMSHAPIIKHYTNSFEALACENILNVVHSWS